MPTKQNLARVPDRPMHAHVTCGQCANRIEITDQLNADVLLIADSLAATVERLTKRCEALDQLATCYRLGKRPSETLLDATTQGADQ